MVRQKPVEQKYISRKLIRVIKMVQTELKQASNSDKRITFVMASDELAKRIVRSKR